jgi:hypothetical protein
MAEMTCIAIDPGDFGDELPSDEFNDLPPNNEYKILTQDEASNDEEEDEDISEDEDVVVSVVDYGGTFTKDEIEE